MLRTGLEIRFELPWPRCAPTAGLIDSRVNRSPRTARALPNRLASNLETGSSQTCPASEFEVAVNRWPGLANCRGALRFDEPMGRHCTWRAGGTAAIFFEPMDRADLQDFVRGVPADLPITWLGLGSNLLVRDAGFPGVVIHTARALGAVARIDNRFRAEAGASCAKLARLAASERFVGGEFLVGIPGSIGGALAMNAGAFGSETWQCVRAVETMDRKGICRWRPATDYQYGYRSLVGPQDEWFLAGEFEFTPAGEQDDPVARGRELLAQRNAAQPTGAASCGSVFRNPPGDFAGRLVEAAGLKGYRVGGCHVSAKHANFIINDAHASATDIETLIEALQAEVRRRFGVVLEPEVRMVGLAADEDDWR